VSIICVIGTGYVGLVTGTCLADMGNSVTCVDIIPEKIERLKQGILPIYEPGLEEMVERNVHAGRLHFTTSYSEGLDNSEFIFIAVNTPTGPGQRGADMRYVESAARSIAEELDHYAVIINKSTVPVGSGDVVSRVLRNNLKRPDARFAVVSNPEFLREGSAVQDFLNPDRVVLGASDPEAAYQVARLYMPLRAPIITTDIYTAEMIKYASNAFLATKISFINEIAQICERLGADIKEVAVGMGYDKRIGRAFLDAGLGYGGSCFEADETVFTLNSPNVAVERFDTLFAKGGRPFAGDVVELVQPSDQRVLAFDLESGEPTLADVKAITRRPYKGTMVKINTSMGRTLRVTADHPVILHKYQQFTIQPAATVIPGDQLMALCALPAASETIHLSLSDLLRRSDDDAITTVQDGQHLALEYTTANKTQADGMALLLQTIGVIPSIRIHRMNKPTREAYILRVSGYEQIAALKSVFGDKHRSRIESILASYQRHIQPHGYERRGAFATLTVRQVEHEDVETTVYSMETSTGTLIASSGLISHNCFPKDVRALAHMADEAGLHPQMLHAVMDINHDQRRLVVTKLTSILGSLRGCTIGILGLAFKPNTDDMREAPSVDIIRWITAQGATIRTYDPVAMQTGREALERAGVRMDAITFCENAYDVAVGADAIVVVTEWNEFKALNMLQIRSAMRRPVLIDGRNIYEIAEMNRIGFIYRAIGRGTGPAPSVLPPGDTTSLPPQQETLGIGEGK
jgi:UDP-glucose 6-dehydrogenase